MKALTWSKHIEIISSKLKRANGVLAKLHHCMPTPLLVSIYYAIFHSHISYACQVWAQRENIYTKRIFLLQKRAARIISKSDWLSHTSPIFYDLKILKFFDIVKFLNILFVYKFLNGKVPSAIRNTFKFQHFDSYSSIRRRKTGVLVQHRFKTFSFGLHSIENQSILSWDTIHSELEIDNLSKLPYSKLQDLIKSFFLDNYID